MFSILEIIEQWPNINIVDVGAMSIGEGTEPYAKLIKRGVANITGFEPVESECKKLNEANIDEKHTFLPYFIGDGRERMFHECNYPMTSSLFEPNTPLLDKFQNLENLTRVIDKYKVKTHRIDDLEQIKDPDYLKVDVQGGEIAVFSGARKRLKDIVLIHTEVCFVPLYKNQPLFAEIDQSLRKHGFVFHKFEGLSGRMFKPVLIKENQYGSMGQKLWADAVYVKDFMSLEKLPAEKLLKLAIILHENYASYDFCAYVLEYFDNVNGSSLRDLYLQKFTGQTI